MTAVTQPTVLCLGDLLHRRLFRVPHFQRAYAWETQQREDLFGDIERLLTGPPDRHHFMSTVVCLRQGKRQLGIDEFDELHVVDGQQRLTTLIILLKAIARALKDDEHADQLHRQLAIGRDKVPVFESNHDSKHRILTSYLLEGKVPDDDDEATTHAERRLIEGIADCETFVQRHAQALDRLTGLIQAVKNRLDFILYQLHDEAAVYAVFESLNSRGIEVEPLDKCKSMLMGAAFHHSGDKASEHVEAIRKDFASVFHTIGLRPIQGSEILRFSATLQAQQTTARILGVDDALHEIASACSDMNAVLGMSAWIRKVTEKVLPLYANPRYKAVTRISHARLLAVAIMLSTLRLNQRTWAMDQWQIVTFRVFGLARRDSRFKVGEYTRLARQLIAERSSWSFAEIAHALKRLGRDVPIKEAIRNQRKTNCYEGWEDECRYLLCRYEESLADDGGSSSKGLNKIWDAEAKATIEHIQPRFPQTKDEGITVADAHRLGNLALLPPGVNERASNRDFQSKKGIYHEVLDGRSAAQWRGKIRKWSHKGQPRMLNEIIAKDKWTLAEIDEREERLLTWAEKAFDDLP